MGLTTPTQIQKVSIPHIIGRKDVIGESATGSGKTLAFGCGVIEHVAPGQGLQALILTPTRELAEQVKNALHEMTGKKRLRIISVYGGVSIDPQIHGLSNAEVAVATPGRLLDHLERRTVDLSRISVLVLDEADRMLDMGFIDDVEKIISQCPGKRQTLFFSATISPRIKELAQRHMASPARVSGIRMVDPAKLKQVYYDVTRNMKLSLLAALLQKESKGLSMIFCNTRRTTEFVVKNLRLNNVNAVSIHGGMTQNKRSKTIELFNRGRINVLVCTDVAARGLHIENVSHIYNYDIPKDPTDYIHRIGRTARAGEEGKVVNLLCDFDYDNFTRLLSDHREFEIAKMEKPHVKRLARFSANNQRRNSGPWRSSTRRNSRFSGNRRGNSGRRW
jgi:ATP-dependent RNA helicase DeaD